MTIRQLLKQIRKCIKDNKSSSPWISGRLTHSIKEKMINHNIEIRNKPDVIDGFLIGIGQYRYIPNNCYDHSGWKML